MRYTFLLFYVWGKATAYKNSADFQPTPSWFTTNHNSNREACACRARPNRNCNSPILFRGGDSEGNGAISSIDIII